MRADVLELLVAPFWRAPAPGPRPHRVHHAAAAAPLAAPVILEPLGGLERLRARVAVDDVATAPGAVREAVRYHPTAVVTLRAGLLGGVAPLEPATAVRANRPKPLHIGRAGGTAQLGRRGLALTRSHVSVPRPRSAGCRRCSSCPPSPPRPPSRFPARETDWGSPPGRRPRHRASAAGPRARSRAATRRGTPWYRCPRSWLQPRPTVPSRTRS